LLAAHNFCKSVQLSLLAADSKQLKNNASYYHCVNQY